MNKNVNLNLKNRNTLYLVLDFTKILECNIDIKMDYTGVYIKMK